MSHLLILLSLAINPPPDGNYLYRFTMIRAAPGKLVEAIDLLHLRAAALASTADEPSFLMRHSQGDHWDLLLVTPMECFACYYSPARTTARTAALRETEDALDAAVAWREDVFVTGPDPATTSERFREFDFFHVEMMVSAPGLRAELYHEREMENDYSRRVGRPENLIFSRVAGAEWEVITIGFYRDVRHFAEGTPDLSQEAMDEAAVAAGFESRGNIGTFLRTLMSHHRDTLAGAVD